MSDIDNGGPAFPSAAHQNVKEGMTLRDYFATKADVMAYQPFETLRFKIGRNPTVSELAEYITQIRLCEADAMMNARKK